MAKQNKHLEHLEDDILNNGSSGGKTSVAFLKSLGDMLSQGDKSKSIKVHERKISPNELSDFEGCFLTGTAAEVTPVSQIDKNNYKVCETILELSSSYDSLVRKRKAA